MSKTQDFPIDPGVKIEILKKELDIWQNTAYLASVRVRVGEGTNNEQYKAQAIKDLENALRAQDIVNKEIEAINAALIEKDMRGA